MQTINKHEMKGVHGGGNLIKAALVVIAAIKLRNTIKDDLASQPKKEPNYPEFQIPFKILM